jgi:hypothetical protein
MWLTLLAVMVGMTAGIVGGGSVFLIGRTRPIAGVLAIAWLALTAITRWVEVPRAHVLFIAADVAALMFCVVNIRRLSTGLLFIGVALNTLVIALNGSMPYRVSAVIRSGLATSASDFPSTVQSRPERSGDLLMALGDVIPVNAGVIHDVLSIGDVLAAFGIAWVVYRAMERHRSPRVGATTPPATVNGGHTGATHATVLGTATQPTVLAQPRASVKDLVARSTIRLGEEFDLTDDEFDAAISSHGPQIARPVTASAVNVVVDLTVDRHRHPDRHLADIQPDTDVMRYVLGVDDDAVLDITEGELPGSVFWAERTKQLARQNQWNSDTRQDAVR